jgi:hypothetical protein
MENHVMKRVEKKSQRQQKPVSKSAITKACELRKWEMSALYNSLKGALGVEPGSKPKKKIGFDEKVMLTRWELLQSQDSLVNAILAEDMKSIRGFFKTPDQISGDSLADIFFAGIEDGQGELVAEILKSSIHPKLLDEALHFAISLGKTKIANMIQASAK